MGWPSKNWKAAETSQASRHHVMATVQAAAKLSKKGNDSKRLDLAHNSGGTTACLPLAQSQTCLTHPFGGSINQKQGFTDGSHSQLFSRSQENHPLKALPSFGLVLASFGPNSEPRSSRGRLCALCGGTWAQPQFTRRALPWRSGYSASFRQLRLDIRERRTTLPI